MKWQRQIGVTAVVCAAMLGGVQAAGAQMEGMAKSKAVVGSQMEPAKAMDAMLSLFEEEFTGVARAMPADKYSFAPATAMVAGSKFDGVRTFASEITHVMQANYYFYAEMSGLKPGVDMKAIGAMKSKDEIIAALAESFMFAHKAIATLTRANAFEVIKGADGMQTRASLAAFGVAHGYDHYGQMVEYLRLNGVLPPGSK